VTAHAGDVSDPIIIQDAKACRLQYATPTVIGKQTVYLVTSEAGFLEKIIPS
jgi:hypothetical protein